MAGRLRTVGAALGRSARRDHRKALALLPRSGRCGGCTAWDTAARRTLELLLAGLADRPTAQRYQAAHGLCLHHVLTLGDGLSAPLPAEVLQARLGVLAWELAEVQRKHAWAVRYEPAGTEAAAWWRAAALLDGRVFCGGPAMPLPASQAPHQATQDDPRSA